jgi:hypothetical protein
LLGPFPDSGRGRIHRSGVVMDKPMKGFLKCFIPFFGGSVLGNPEYSVHSSSVAQSPCLKGSKGRKFFSV